MGEITQFYVENIEMNPAVVNMDQNEYYSQGNILYMYDLFQWIIKLRLSVTSKIFWHYCFYVYFAESYSDIEERLAESSYSQKRKHLLQRGIIDSYIEIEKSNTAKHYYS